MKYDICVFGGCALDQFYYKDKKAGKRIVMVMKKQNKDDSLKIQLGYIIRWQWMMMWFQA